MKGAAGAALGAAAFGIVGCGDDDNSSGGSSKGLLPTASAGTATAKTPKPGGSLNVGWPAINPNMDPYTQTSYQTAYATSMVYSKLVRFKAGTPDIAPADNSMEPDLAAAMPEQPDQMTYVFKL